MANPEASIILSIKPKYAELILSGCKTVELRKIRPKLFKGDMVYMYASSPTRAVVGSFTVECIVSASPGRLWRLVQALAGVTKREYNEYYAGKKVAHAIFIQRVTSFNPIHVEEIRKQVLGFAPPQSFIYVKPLIVSVA